MTDDRRQMIVSEARGWVGVPFKRFGATRAGVDCVGLIRSVYRSVAGMDMVARYERRPTSGHAFGEITKVADRINQSDALAGDIVQCVYAGCAVHFGILTGRGTVIHAAAFARRVIESALPSDGDGRPVAFWRVRGA